MVISLPFGVERLMNWLVLTLGLPANCSVPSCGPALWLWLCFVTWAHLHHPPRVVTREDRGEFVVSPTAFQNDCVWSQTLASPGASLCGAQLHCFSMVRCSYLCCTTHVVILDQVFRPCRLHLHWAHHLPLAPLPSCRYCLVKALSFGTCFTVLLVPL